jgi:hypothetical protein
MIFLLLYTATYMPYKASFLDEDTIINGGTVIDFIIDTLFFVDIIFNFISAYDDQNGNIQFNLKKIAKRYVRSWFFLDLIACIPFSYINTNRKTSNYNKFLRLLRLPRLYKIFKILHLLR